MTYDNWKSSNSSDNELGSNPKYQDVATEKIYVTLLNSGASELDRATIYDGTEEDRPDEAELSNIIHQTIETWMLAIGDTITIVEEQVTHD